MPHLAIQIAGRIWRAPRVKRASALYSNTTYGVFGTMMTQSNAKFTRRQAMIAGAAAAATLGLPMGAQAASFAKGDMIMGRENAPITIIEYASMTCPHCANFHHNIFPKLKAEWIDTGKVKFIFREFPFDRRGLDAAALARCGGKRSFFKFIDTLFQTQREWARASDGRAALAQIGRLGGISQKRFDACMADRGLQDLLLQSRQTAVNKYSVNATPTLIINGEKFRDHSDWDDVNEHLKSLL